MCTPALAVPLLIGSAAVSGVGAYTQTSAANKAASFNQQVMEQNALDAQQRGAKEESKFRMQLSQLQGRQRASQAASGGLVDAGSGADINEQTQYFGEQDALTIKYNADLEAAGYRNQARLAGAQRRSTALAVGTSLLGSLSPLALKYSGNGKTSSTN